MSTFNVRYPSGGGNVGTVTAVALSGGTTGITVSGSPITTSGTMTLGGTLVIANGGTGQTTANAAFNALSPSTTKGDLIGFSTVNARLAVGTNGQLLTAASGQTTGLIWQTGIQGITNASDAAAGFVGEYMVATASNQAMPTTNTFGDAVSLSLTAGDWDVTHQVYFAANGTTYTDCTTGISTTSGNSSSGLVLGDNSMISAPTNANDSSNVIAAYRVNINSTTTYYGKVKARWSGGSPTYYARMSARRVR